MDTPKKITNVKLTAADHERMVAAAHAMGLSRRDFMIQAATLLAAMDPDTWALVTSWADRLQLSPAAVLRALALARLAEIDAEGEALGDPGRVDLPEFRMTADGPLAARHLLAILKAEHVAELQKAAATIGDPPPTGRPRWPKI